MKDLITAATTGLFVEVGRVIEHMKVQQARIADLERQLAEASAPAVERKPVGQIVDRNGGHNTPSLPPTPMPVWFNSMPAIGVKLYAAPQAADTDKVREALNGLHNDIMNLPHQMPITKYAVGTEAFIAYKEGHRDARHAAAELVASMAGDMG